MLHLSSILDKIFGAESNKSSKMDWSRKLGVIHKF